KLGTNRGAWREVFEPQTVGFSVMTIPRSQDLLTLGREVYNSRCVGCHGKGGDGNGLAATFLSPRPRNFTLGVFKFRTTASGSLPEGQGLAVPRRGGQRRWRVGGGADRRPQVSDPPGRLHPRSVQGRLDRARHLPHDDPRPRRLADALVRRLDERGGALGHLVLHPVAFGLEGSADGRNPRPPGRGARGAQLAGDRRRPSALRPRSSPARAGRREERQATN